MLSSGFLSPALRNTYELVVLKHSKRKDSTHFITLRNTYELVVLKLVSGVLLILAAKLLETLTN